MLDVGDTGDFSGETGARLPSFQRIGEDVLDHLQEGCQLVGPDWRYIYVNAAAARHGKTTRELLLGRTMMEAYPGIENTVVFEHIRTCMSERTPQELDNKFNYPDGSEGWFELRIEPVPQGVFILSLDVTKRRLAEQEVKRAKSEFRSLIEHLDGVVFSLDTSGKFTFVSKVVESLGFTQAELIGTHFSTLMPVAQKQEMEEAFRVSLTKRRGTREFKMLARSGKERHIKCLWRVIRDGGKVSGMTGILYDKTDQRGIEEQLRVAQRLESVGLLAGGIAHDFNNLLSVILSYSGFAMDELPEGSRLRRDVSQIQKAGQRAAELTRQLLVFSRRQVMQPEILNLNGILENIEPMFRRLIRSDIELVLNLDPELPNINADRGQMEQVVTNLVLNSRDAIQDSGKISISTRPIELDDEYASMHLQVKPGSYVLLTVADNGAGMSPEVKERVFEPFFTTKESGKGTGLGLATVFGIVKQSEGNIYIYSELGLGTTIKVYLPVAKSTDRAASIPKQGDFAPNGSETILLAEDEPQVREAAERILTKYGYRVLSAGDGASALKLLETCGETVHLLLTDVVMPGMGGGELAAKVREARPDTRVLYMSGYCNDSLIQKGTLNGGSRVVAKPFSANSLAQQVREALN
jgi:two-component system cell cycle sensor histidine kinase/response regulator CckA